MPLDIHAYLRLAATSIATWHARARQRRQLLELAESSPDILADIGVSREQALAEAYRPFWEPLRRRATVKVCTCGGLGHPLLMRA
jgi:uncharacterized protein YjiS (DUF1127 family)